MTEPASLHRYLAEHLDDEHLEREVEHLAANGDMWAEWTSALCVVEPGRVVAVLDELPSVTEAVVPAADERPFVFVIENRPGWVCTATGQRGSGLVAVLRPRDTESEGPRAVLSIEALRMAVEALERLTPG